MSFTAALLILLLGLAIGYHLPGPVSRLKALLRRRTYKPVLLRPVRNGKETKEAVTPTPPDKSCTP